MSADVKTSAELAEDLDRLLKRNGHLLSFADVCIVTRAILALREAAPHHPGRQTLVTARNESGVDGPPPLITSASPGPDHETLIVERLRSIHAELLAAAEEERSRNV